MQAQVHFLVDGFMALLARTVTNRSVRQDVVMFHSGCPTARRFSDGAVLLYELLQKRRNHIVLEKTPVRGD